MFPVFVVRSKGVEPRVDSTKAGLNCGSLGRVQFAETFTFVGTAAGGKLDGELDGGGGGVLVYSAALIADDLLSNKALICRSCLEVKRGTLVGPAEVLFAE